MLRMLLAAILAIAVSTAGAQIVNRPVAAGAISSPSTTAPTTCAVGNLFFKTNATAGQNLQLCTAANTWTGLIDGSAAGSFTTLNVSGTTTTAAINASAQVAVTATNLTTSVVSARYNSGNQKIAFNIGNGNGNGMLDWNFTPVASSDQPNYDLTAPGARLAFNTAGSGGFHFSTAPSGTAASAATIVEQFRVAHTATAVNYTQATGSATGSPTVVSAQGSDATIALQLSPKSSSPNTGAVLVKNSGSGATAIRTAQTTAPTCTTNCGTSPSIAGTDTAGVVTMGASGVPASGWVVTFNGTWSAAPSCNVQSALSTMVVGKQPIAVQVSTTTMTVTTNGTAPATSDKYQYICIGVS